MSHAVRDRRRARGSRRTALVPLELVLALPLLVILLLVVLTCGSAFYAIGSATQGARLDAWRQRNASSEATTFDETAPELPQELHDRLARLLPSGSQDPAWGGKIAVERTAPLSYVASSLEGSLGAAERSHALHVGVWDSEVLRFTPHPRLTFEPLLREFLLRPGMADGASAIALDAFQDLVP